jgi:hypothetical protein
MNLWYHFMVCVLKKLLEGEDFDNPTRKQNGHMAGKQTAS